MRQLGAQAESIALPWTPAADATRGPLLRRLRRGVRIWRANRLVLGMARRFAPHAVFLSVPEPLTRETILALRSRSILAIRVMDSLPNTRIPYETIALADLPVMFEPDDLAQIAGSRYLPWAVDPSIYRPLQLEPLYDLCFVGAPRDERLEFLDRLARFCAEHGLRFALAGPNYRKRRAMGGKDPKREYPHLLSALVADRNLAHEEVNELYNRSTMVLNLHAAQSKAGINVRTFEIAASGSLQVVDYHAALTSFFEPDEELAVYHDETELHRVLLHYAHAPDERRRKAEAARRRVLAEHTYEHRCRTLWNWFGELAKERGLPLPPLLSSPIGDDCQ
jgi:spore maturation protein CgeB